jgi:hypothetical protein
MQLIYPRSLSTYLAEALPDNNTRYTQAATNTVRFLRTQLFERDFNVFRDGLSGRAGQGSCVVDSPTYPFNTALFLEGLTVLSRVQGDNNTEYKDL